VACSVLVIDNDVTLTDVLKATLDSNTFQVYCAHQVDEGIDAVHTLNPDVIILDLYLPEKDGSHVCRDIRAFSDTPILILSVLNNPEAIARALDEGADDYLIKPVKSGVLAAHLKKLIRRNNRAQASLKPH
jgi:two-component system response regulator ParR